LGGVAAPAVRSLSPVGKWLGGASAVATGDALVDKVRGRAAADWESGPALCAKMGETVPPSEIAVGGGKGPPWKRGLRWAVTPQDVQVAAKLQRGSSTAEYMSTPRAADPPDRVSDDRREPTP
jgi:hypothetical protein